MDTAWLFNYNYISFRNWNSHYGNPHITYSRYMNNDDIKNRLKEIFPSPEVASAVVDLVVKGEKPQGWSRRSNAPYFKKIYAEQIKREVDKMIETKSSIVFRYSVWCNDNRMSPSTLYNRINQSIRYLVEKMDHDNYYQHWYESVKVERRTKVGVVIEYIAGMESDEGFSAEPIMSREQMPLWKRKMEEWLEGDSIIPFVQEGLALTPDEILELKQQFAQLTSVAASITSSVIKIIKMQ